MTTLYSIVDIETTGGRTRDNKITEIAIVVFDGEKVVKSFDTLINPEKYIPLSITSLTGITNEMVEQSPKFYEVAKNIIETLEGTTFVAHNVFFDFNFIKKEFAELGYDFNMPKLCTVKLARKYIPGHKSYSLGKVCEDLGIKIEGRHRALGDAKATIELFKIILKNSMSEELIDSASEKKLVLPYGLNFDDIQSLPSRCGIYYFLDQDEEIIYVGKSTDIQKRVRSHFYNKSLNKRQLSFKEKVSSFDTFVIGHEWVSLIIEACEIKRLRPPLNRALNRSRFRFAVVIDKENDYWMLRIQTSIDDSCNKALTYRSRKTALAAIEKFYNVAFGVSKESLHWDSFKQKIPHESFNKMLEQVIDKRSYPFFNFSLRVDCDILNSFILLEFRDDHLTQINFYDDNGKNNTYEVNEDPDIKRIVLKKLRTYKSKITVIQDEIEQGPHEWHT